MNRNETTMIIATLKMAYPSSFKDLSEEDASATVNLWQMLLADEPFEDVKNAVMALVSTRTVGYSPTIGEVKEKLFQLRNPHERSETEAWALVSRACRNGYYGYKEEFEKLPLDVQRAVGAPEVLKQWAMIPTDELETVTASNFRKSYSTMQTRDRELAKIPMSVRLAANVLKELPE